MKELFEKIAASHVRFERIHSFSDGNGRTGRMIVNQQLINSGFLPVSIPPTGKYREAFRRYDKSEDLSEMVYVLLKSELDSFDRVRSLAQKFALDREKQKSEDNFVVLLRDVKHAKRDRRHPPCGGKQKRISGPASSGR